MTFSKKFLEGFENYKAALLLILFVLPVVVHGQQIQNELAPKNLLASADSIVNKQGDYELATEIYQKTAEYYLSKQDTLNYLVSKLSYAKCLFYLGQYKESEDWAKSLTEILQKKPQQSTLLYLRALREAGITFLNLQTQLQLSEELFLSAKRIDDEARLLTPLLVARNYANLAGSQYYQSKFKEASLNYEKARKIAESDSTIDQSTYIQILLAESVVNGDLGLYSKALDRMEQLLHSFREMGNQAFEAWVLSSMGRIHFFREAYNKSIDYSSQAIRLYEQIGQPNHQTAIISRHHLAESLKSLKQYDAAIKELRKNYRIESELLGDVHPNHIYTFQSLSDAYLKVKPDSSLFFLNKAKALVLKNEGSEGDLFADLEMNFTNIYRQAEDYEKALVHSQNSYQLLKKLHGESHPLTIRAINLLANTFSGHHQYDTAISLYKKSIKLNSIQNGHDFLIQKHISPEVYVQTLGELGKIYGEATDLQEADELSIRYFEMYDSLVSVLRSEINYPSDQSMLWGDLRMNFNTIVPAFVQRFKITAQETDLIKAWNKVAKVKYLSLNEQLAIQDGQTRRGDSTLEVSKALEKEIGKLKSQLLEEREQEVQMELESKLFNLYQEYTKANQSLSNSIASAVPDLDLRHSIETISQKTGVIEYFLTDDLLYIFYGKGYLLGVETVQLKESFHKNLAQYIEYLKSPQETNFEIFKQIGHELYQILLEPIAEKIGLENLVIIPDQQLHLLPFESLLYKNSAESTSYNKLPYIITLSNIVYAPSIATLEQFNRGSKVTYGKGLAFSPSFETYKNANDSLIKQSDIYPELFWANKEVSLASEYFDGNVFTGKEADESALKNLKSNPMILHLATHGYIDNINPEYSHLLLPVDSESTEDGKLHSFEIHNTNLNTQLTILSACNTGNGQIVEGEGVISMANSFFRAGSKSVIMSLWLANDESTFKIIQGLYSNLSNQQSKSQALRESKLNYLETSVEAVAHPFYWSHLILSGDDSPVISKKTPGYILLLGVLIVLVLTSVLVINRLKKVSYD